MYFLFAIVSGFATPDFFIDTCDVSRKDGGQITSDVVALHANGHVWQNHNPQLGKSYPL